MMSLIADDFVFRFISNESNIARFYHEPYVHDPNSKDATICQKHLCFVCTANVVGQAIVTIANPMIWNICSKFRKDIRRLLPPLILQQDKGESTFDAFCVCSFFANTAANNNILSRAHVTCENIKTICASHRIPSFYPIDPTFNIVMTVEELEEAYLKQKLDTIWWNTKPLRAIPAVAEMGIVHNQPLSGIDNTIQLGVV